MSGWDPSWPRSAPKKPPPEHGLKMKKAGTTWWGQRWIEALERVLRGDAGRLARGKTYARAGRTHDLLVVGGKISAKVTGSRATPYEVSIEIAQLSDEAWRRAIAGMAHQARFAAELLAGQMPLAIDDVFRDAGMSLFPAERADLGTTCSCPDWGDPCKHVAATHYLLGEALDQDPFLLFELRGRSKERVLAGIRGARGATPADEAPPPYDLAPAGADEVATVTLDAIGAADYDRTPHVLPTLDFTFDVPSTPAAVLRQLGAPAAWRADGSPAERLSPLVRRAADFARRIALRESEAVSEAPPKEHAGRRSASPEAAPAVIGAPTARKTAKKQRRARARPKAESGRAAPAQRKAQPKATPAVRPPSRSGRRLKPA
jgi:uncharacterized Zn finger protein